MSNSTKFEILKTFAPRAVVVVLAFVLSPTSFAQSVNPWNSSQAPAQPNSPPVYFEPQNNFPTQPAQNNQPDIYASPNLFNQFGARQYPNQQPTNNPQFPNSGNIQAPLGTGGVPQNGGPPVYPSNGYVGSGVQNGYAVPNGYGTQFAPSGYGTQYAPNGFVQPNNGYGGVPNIGYGAPSNYGSQYAPNGNALPYGYSGGQYAPYGYGQPQGYGGGQPLGYGAPYSGGGFPAYGYPGGPSNYSNNIPSGRSPFFGNDLFGFR